MAVRVSGALTTSILGRLFNTPLIRIRAIGKEFRDVELWAKAEWFNPGGSVKDRPAYWMVREAARRGELTPDKILLDSTSGNTGISYAMLGAVLGYRVKLVMPNNASEKKKIIQAYGAEVVLTDPLKSSDGAILEAQRIYAAEPGRYYMPDQYNNPHNPRAHEMTTAPEIWKQTRGRVTHFVAGMGTAGTVMGTGRGLKRFRKTIRVVAVEPAESLHGLEGLKQMASSIVPGIYRAEGHDEKEPVPTEEAYDMVHRLAREEGLLVGQSSGAVMVGALNVARRLQLVLRTDSRVPRGVLSSVGAT
ncbi:MAG: cysteine synthase family protein, partial [bacterium]